MGKVKDLTESLDFLEANIDRVPQEFQDHIKDLLEVINRIMMVTSQDLKGSPNLAGVSIIAQDHYEGDY